MGGLLGDILSLGGLLGDGNELAVGGEVGGFFEDITNPQKLLEDLLSLPQDALREVQNIINISGNGNGNGGASDALFTTTITEKPIGEPGLLQGFSGGNGKTANRTLVQTLDLASGRIVRTRVLPGTPFLMNADVSAAKRVFKLSSKLHGKMPRRTVKESEVTKLKNAAVQQAMQTISCPPPPCK